MTFEWIFECGTRIKHNNWSMHAFAMLLLHANGNWTNDKLETEVNALGMHRSSVMNGIRGMAPDGADSQTGRIVNDKSKQLHIILNVQKVPVESLEELTDELTIHDEEYNGESEAWIAKINFAKKPTPEEIEQFKETFEKNSKDVIMQAIQQSKRGDYLEKEATSPLNLAFRKMLKCDGEEVNCLEAIYLLGLLTKVPSFAHDILSEVVSKEEITNIATGLFYSASQEIPFKVY